jgi:hypothetical protein
MDKRTVQLAAAIASLTALVLVTPCANAQFGLPMQLPKEDFIWMWGKLRDAQQTGFADFSITGGESGFRCELTGRLSPASGISAPEIRDLENYLRSSLFFIQEAATAMNQMEYNRSISWAQLNCDKYEDDPDEATSQEREDRARERAERKREQRRAREEE